MHLMGGTCTEGIRFVGCKEERKREREGQEEVPLRADWGYFQTKIG